MMPQMKRSTATASTSSRLPSEKSTSLRSIDPIPQASLLDGVLEDERVGNDTFTRLQPRAELLHAAVQHRAGDDLAALEAPVLGRHVHPVAIVQVQNGGSGHDRARLGRAAVEG